MTSPIVIRFGHLVRRHRIALGLNQSDLARRADLSRTSIVNIEAGRQATTLDGLVRLAHALELRTLDDLVPFERPQDWCPDGIIDWTVFAHQNRAQPI